MRSFHVGENDGEVVPYVRKFVPNLLAIVIVLTASACGDNVTEQTSTSEIKHEQVRQYLLEHPELVLDDLEIAYSISRARSKREHEIETFQRKSVIEEQANLLNSPLTPSSGHTNSVVTLIEFYDYQCSPCKANYPELEEMRASETDVRIIYGQLPIFGSQSILAARAAIAAHRQGLFDAYHTALMTTDTPLNIDLIFAMSAEVGLNLKKLQVDMRDPQVIQYLEEMRLLAESLNVTGTPTYIVGGAILRGGTTVEELKEELQRYRAQK